MRDTVAGEVGPAVHELEGRLDAVDPVDIGSPSNLLIINSSRSSPTIA
jgi:hypothetical protein